jgi:hypothetical protein
MHKKELLAIMTTAITITKAEEKQINSLAASIRRHTEEARSAREELHNLLNEKGFGVASGNTTAATPLYTVFLARNSARAYDQDAVKGLRETISPEAFFELFKYSPAAGAREFDFTSKELGLYEATRGLFTTNLAPEHIAVYTAESWRKICFSIARKARKPKQKRQQRAAPKNGAIKAARRPAKNRGAKAPAKERI